MKTKKKNLGFFNSIRTKITLVAVIILALCLVQVISTAKGFAENRLTESQTNTLESIANEKSINVAQYIDDQKVIAELIRDDSDVVAEAHKYYQTHNRIQRAQEEMAEKFKAIYQNTGEIYDSLLFTVDSIGFADCFDNSTIRNVKDETFYIECKENGYYEGREISARTGNPVYTIAYAVYDSNTGDFAGTICLSLDLVKMGNTVLKSDEYTITLLDFEGYIVSTNAGTGDIMTNIAFTDPEGFQAILNTKQGWNLVDLSMWGGPLQYLAYSVNDYFIAEVSVDASVIETPISQMKTNLTYVAFAMGLLGVIVMIIFISLLIKPLKKATKNVDSLAAELEKGEGDLSKAIVTKSTDEIGVMVSGINNLIQTISNVILGVQTASGTISVSSSEIREEIERAQMEINNVSATMEEMSASSEETSASMTQVLSQIENVAEQVNAVNDQSVSQAKYAADVVEKVNDIREDSIKFRKESEAHLSEVAENLRDKINNANQVQEIANLTDEILKITSKTNLLALNASIEAARAGEAGRGFAVVADEIRALADSSKDAANRIQEVTANVIVAVNDLATEAENVTDFMLKNNESTSAETEKLTVSYSEDIMKLAQAMNEFKASSDEIHSSMDVIREAIDAVNIASEETAQGITNVATSTVELSGQLDSVVGKTAENLTVVTELTDKVNRYTV